MRTSATRLADDRARRSRRSPRLALAVQYAVARTGLPAAPSLRRWASAALERDARVTLRFVGLVEARTLNALYRGKDYATNVLTFVYDDAVPLAGDIVLCVPVLRHEARAGGRTLRAHCAHLVVHGMLHLQGHDHASDREAVRMEARETALLATLGVDDPYEPRESAEHRRTAPRRRRPTGRPEVDAVPAARISRNGNASTPPPAGGSARRRISGKPGGS